MRPKGGDKISITRVKICGITNIHDALHAVKSGADAIGMVFAESPRRISLSMATKISRALGPWISVVGVFVNEKPERIMPIVEKCRLTAVQLHGDERPAELKKIKGVNIIKAFRVESKEDLRQLQDYPADAYLFDSKARSVYGGSGLSFDWNLLKSLRLKKPVIVSGGLNAENVHSVIDLLSPYGVDASSSLETSPGKKNPELVRRFIKNVKKN